MARFRMVHTEFWDDPKVVEEMTPEDKYFFLYLLTNANTTQIGIYQITKKQMAFDTGYSLESINALLDRFINHHEIVVYNPKTREIALRNWGKYNFNRGGKPVIDCVKSELNQVKDKSLISLVAERIEKQEIKKIYDSFYDASTISGQEEENQEKEEQEKDVEKKSATTSNTIAFYQDNFGHISPHIAEEILSWVKKLGNEMVIEALSRSLNRNKPNWGYAKSILLSWVKKNITNINQAQAEEIMYLKQVHSEVVPDWFKERKGNANHFSKELESSREEVAALLAHYRKSAGSS
ncbi:DnaD domain protein [Ornithinibacillus massiliensis]|uniref:DnaD domain protein n=1 Tax=Ornithinibacillus massiliensis TaxID=1944633 RepID=A0ABS5MI75_9BACI|nr:DnaD domain protein [Ornithinibacillus massiliensis]MBS3681778.1 DnaD domain protein [Ornithinibacillus massiliensis]